ncbi:hypothetical protein FACS189427_09070 [Planctomycetales bacterium]|nr:hypothetical protein FACS189427_09070 [Planctomycetales bacterium]
MNKFSLYFCAAVIAGLFLSVPYLNAQSKDNAAGGDKAKAAKPADTKPAAPAAEPKPVSSDKPLTHYKAWNIDADLGKRQDEFVKGSGGANAVPKFLLP